MRPFLVVIVVALVVSGAVAAYSLFVARGAQSIAITVAALAVMGVTMGIGSVALAAAAVRAGRDARAVPALAGGCASGLFILGASAALSAALVFGLLSRM